MGAGKTTVGRLLAQKIGWDFADLDDLIVKREGRSVAEIFREAGEPYFRRIETDCLRERLPNRADNLVLALGGGAIVQPENASLIVQSQLPVVFLDAPLEELRRRCGEQAGIRPLFSDENHFRQLYESRRGSYMSAGVRIDTASLSPEQVADEIVRRLDLRVHTRQESP